MTDDMILILITGYWFLCGVCLGSFLNVVIYRLPLGESVVSPRSRCCKCKRTVAWYDNIPIISYCFLWGACRHCSVKISFRYPIVEFLMGCLAAALWLRFGLSWEFLIWLPLSAALIAITFIDIDHWLIPDAIVYPMALWVIFGAFLPGGITPKAALWGLAPAGLIFLVGWGFQLITGREALGLGDVKLLALLGLAVGPIEGLGIVLLSSLQGAFIGICLRIFTLGHEAQKNGGNRSGQEGGDQVNAEEGEGAEDIWEPEPYAFPYGPFIAIATFQVVLLPEYFGDLVFTVASLMLGERI